MSKPDSAPLYNLKAVVRETSLKPDTLRAWERRYGLPEPQRTPSGHRLYSDHDIAILKWLINRQQEGLSISRAVALWHQLIEDDKDPIAINNAEKNSTGLPTILRAEVEATLPLPENPEVIDQLRQRWLFACLAFDEQQAEQILEQAFSFFSLEKVCLQLLQKGLAEIGIGWTHRTITAQQEHFASALAMRRLQSLLTATPSPTRPERILVGCPPEETHSFSSMLFTLLLRRRGWNVIYLGADVPLESIQDTVANTHPNLIVLVAQQLHTAATLLEIIRALIDTKVPIAFGGAIFSQCKVLQDRIPGHYLGDQLENAVPSVEKILQLSQQEKDDVRHENRFNPEAAHLFQQNRSQIEAIVWKKMEASAIGRSFLSTANASLGRTIRAILTLQLESIELTEFDHQWFCNTLDSRYSASDSDISRYLTAYGDAVQLHMPSYAATIAPWLQRLESMQPKSI